MRYLKTFEGYNDKSLAREIAESDLDKSINSLEEFKKYYRSLVSKTSNLTLEMDWIDDIDGEIHKPINSNENILNILYEIYVPGYKILDVGCGFGSILKVCKKMGYKVYGSELVKNFTYYKSNGDQVNKEIAEYHKGLNVVYGNFLDMSNISEFDVIYLYRPTDDMQIMDRIIDKILKECKPGCKILYVYPHISTELNNKYFINVIKSMSSGESYQKSGDGTGSFILIEKK